MQKIKNGQENQMCLILKIEAQFTKKKIVGDQNCSTRRTKNELERFCQ